MKLITIVQLAMLKAEDQANVNLEAILSLKDEIPYEENMEAYVKSFHECLDNYAYLRKCLHRMSKEHEVQKTLEDVLEW